MRGGLQSCPMPRMILVFDVNQTLLSLEPLDRELRRVFGENGSEPSAATERWFGQLLQLSLTSTLSGSYRDFSRLAEEALLLTARKAGIEATAADQQAVSAAMERLPAHADVRPALETLRGAGFRLAALSNSSSRMLDAQLRHAGLSEFFEQAISVDRVGKYKPHPAVYQAAADALGAAPGELRMTAAHNWDVSGAMRAGLRAAFVARAGAVLGELDERPEIIAGDMAEAAARIIELDG